VPRERRLRRHDPLKEDGMILGFFLPTDTTNGSVADLWAAIILAPIAIVFVICVKQTLINRHDQQRARRRGRIMS
jgi:hypothetical protein